MSRRDRAEFELVISGGLGPALRKALGPDLEARTHTCTTIVAGSLAAVGTVVARVEPLDLVVESIVARVDPRADTLDG